MKKSSETPVDDGLGRAKTPDAPRRKQESARQRLRAWLPLLILVAGLAFALAQGWHRYLSLSVLIQERANLQHFIESHLLLGVGAYVGLYALAVALSFPGASLMTIVGGFLFGWFYGGGLTALAATVGAIAVFLAARSSLGAFLSARAGPFMSRMADGFREDAFNYLLFLRLTPIFPFWLINIAPALFQMRLSPYALATFIGILPGTYAYSFLGAGLDSIVAAQEAANPGCAAAGSCEIELSALITPQVIIAMIVLGLVSLLPIAAKKMRRTNKNPD